MEFEFDAKTQKLLLALNAWIKLSKTERRIAKCLYQTELDLKNNFKKVITLAEECRCAPQTIRKFMRKHTSYVKRVIRKIAIDRNKTNIYICQKDLLSLMKIVISRKWLDKTTSYLKRVRKSWVICSKDPEEIQSYEQNSIEEMQKSSPPPPEKFGVLSSFRENIYINSSVYTPTGFQEKSYQDFMLPEGWDKLPSDCKTYLGHKLKELTQRGLHSLRCAEAEKVSIRNPRAYLERVWGAYMLQEGTRITNFYGGRRR